MTGPSRNLAPSAEHPGVLISLPQGLGLGGVPTWALTLAQGLASSGWPLAIVIQGEIWRPERLRALPPTVHIEAISPADDLARACARARAALGPDRDTVAIANLTSGSIDALLAAGAHQPRTASRTRLALWIHNDIEHDYRLAQHYAPVLDSVVAVSRRITSELRRRLPDPALTIDHVPYGVRPAHSPPAPEALDRRAIRLIYPGRIDRFQKRVAALINMADALDERRLPYELRLIGDGPAAAEIDAALRSRPRISRTPALWGDDMLAQLRRAHIFLLPSRFEGLSIAMLEAMGQGLAPVVTRVASGADEAIEHDISGVLVDPSGSDDAVGRRLALAVQQLAADPARLARTRQHAWARVVNHFTDELHIRRAASALAAAATRTPRHTRAQAPDPGQAFTVPHDAPERARRALESLTGRRVALWGAGRHTLAVTSALDSAPAHVVALIDDDPANHGSRAAGRPVLAPHAALNMGVTDVLISSAIHEPALWERRGELERLGLRVHRMYAA
ncbi:MAG: glycosyltransferase [Planctomycetota bacterium]|nr:glycosyltransferase [Planctomycetota bacterium]